MRLRIHHKDNHFNLAEGDRVTVMGEGCVWTIQRVWFTGKVDLAAGDETKSVHVKYLTPYEDGCVGWFYEGVWGTRPQDAKDLRRYKRRGIDGQPLHSGN